MTEPEQWRFQWPDGTWIRWNPQTQSWEKEAAGANAPGATESLAPAEETVVEEVPIHEPAAEEPVLEVPLVEEPLVEVPADNEPDMETPERALPSRRELRTGRTTRSMVGDVLPPHSEPERPGGSLWPTVLTGMVIGLGVGLLIWNLIR